METQRLIDYVHGTLPPQEREAVEQALRTDPSLQNQIKEIRKTQERMQGLVSAEINAAPIPATMQYSAISAQVKNRKPKLRSPRLRFLTQFAAIASILILGFAIWYSLPDSDNGIEAGAPNPTTIISTPTIPALPTITPTIDPNATPTEEIFTIPERTPEPESFFTPRGLNLYYGHSASADGRGVHIYLTI